MDEPAPRIFDADYQEDVVLRDGTRARLRLIQPDDKDLVLDGLQRMSPESRYRRFFMARDTLTEQELRYLTEVDQHDHFAIGAVLIHERADEADVHDGLGVGRFIRHQDDPRVAEAAIAVVDSMHGQGLGRLLFKRLVVAARERGIDEFHVSLLADNEVMLGLLRSMFPNHTLIPEGDIVIVDCPLPNVTIGAPDERPEGPLYKVFGLAAEGVLEVLRRARTWPIPDDLAANLIVEDPRPEQIVTKKE